MQINRLQEAFSMLETDISRQRAEAEQKQAQPEGDRVVLSAAGLKAARGLASNEPNQAGLKTAGKAPQDEDNDDPTQKIQRQIEKLRKEQEKLQEEMQALRQQPQSDARDQEIAAKQAQISAIQTQIAALSQEMMENAGGGTGPTGATGGTPV